MRTAAAEQQTDIYRHIIQRSNCTDLFRTRKKEASKLYNTVAKQQRIQQQIFTLTPTAIFLFETLNSAGQLGNLPLKCQPVAAYIGAGA